jgi:hypothetical protein
MINTPKVLELKSPADMPMGYVLLADSGIA